MDGFIRAVLLLVWFDQGRGHEEKRVDEIFSAFDQLTRPLHLSRWGGDTVSGLAHELHEAARLEVDRPAFALKAC